MEEGRNPSLPLLSANHGNKHSKDGQTEAEDNYVVTFDDHHQFAFAPLIISSFLTHIGGPNRHSIKSNEENKDELSRPRFIQEEAEEDIITKLKYAQNDEPRYKRETFTLSFPRGTIGFLLFLLFNSFKTGDSTSRHTVAAIQGDLVLGALFPVHHAPSATQAQTRTCGEIREQYGIHRVEAAFLAIDKINRDNTVLPNITLGIEIRDSCWYSPIALEQSIEFIRDAISASEETKDTTTSLRTSGGLFGGRHFSSNETSQAKEKHLLQAFGNIPLVPLINPMLQLNLNGSQYCPKSTKKIKNLVGVIGPASSTVTIQVQNLLQLFNIPQIGYSATSRDLSDKNYYKYFLRVVPSDYFQAKVMVDFISKHNWTYISVIYTDGNYGSSLMELFKGLAQDAKICIANTESVFNNADEEELDNILRNLQQYSSTAKVVACFCEGMTVRGILKSIRRLNATGELVLIGSDGWSDRPDVVEDYEKEAVGGISVRIHSPYVNNFDGYYFSLRPDNNSRNPWFREFWESKFNCSLPPQLDQPKSPKLPVFNRTCTGKESLSDKYKQDTKMAFVMKAIYTMAHGLDKMQRSMCPKKPGLCPEMLPINGSILLQNLLNVSFTFEEDLVEFDQFGDPPGRYDIMNFQKVDSDNYTYVHIGSWDSSGGNFTILHQIQWPMPTEGNDTTTAPESVCSRPCPKGQAKNIQSDSVKCCWVCVPCRENQYLENEYKCENCPLGWWPNDNLTACNRIPIEFVHWTETPSLIAMGIAIIGFITTFFTMVVFIKHNNTPIVKASTRELSYMILIGMFLCYTTTFFLIAKPTQLTCLISQILPGFSFAVIYASLVTKTNRIARILAGSKKRIITKKLRFMSSGAQVVISLILICVESSIIGFVLIKEPADSMLAYPALNKVHLVCNTSTLGIVAPLGFDFFLIVMCTVYAIKTRNVPENFNEAKFIGFTMYTTIVIWIAFVPLYFGSFLKVLTMCLSISFSAIVALVLLFFPKLYIIIFKPEKNNRSYFTTAKNVRCHIGYVPTVGISRHSSHSTSDFSVDSPRNHSLEVQHHNLPPHLKRNSGDKLSAHLIHEKGGSSLADASGTSALKSGSSSSKPSRKLNFNIFERLRLNKQDKIAANVQRKIRAVRAAEALDRQTNRRGGARMPPRTVTSSTIDTSDQDTTENQRMRLISFLRHTYGEDCKRIPGFLELVEATKAESKKSWREASSQTSYDLLETWFPAISSRLQKTEANVVDSEGQGSQLGPKPSSSSMLVKSSSVRSRSQQPQQSWSQDQQQHQPHQQLQHQQQQQQAQYTEKDLLVQWSSAATMKSGTREGASSALASEYRTNRQPLTWSEMRSFVESSASDAYRDSAATQSSLSMLGVRGTVSPTKAISSHMRHAVQTPYYQQEQLQRYQQQQQQQYEQYQQVQTQFHSHQEPQYQPQRSRGEPSTQPQVFVSMASSVGTQTPHARRRGSFVSATDSAKGRTSEESLLSGNGSCVIEESASSGGETSPCTGVVYKNIIISLGEHQGSTSVLPGSTFEEQRRASSKSLRREPPHFR